MKVKVLGRGLKMDEFVSKTELAQSFQRHEPIQKLLMKFTVRDKCCKVLKVKGSLLSLNQGRVSGSKYQDQDPR